MDTVVGDENPAIPSNSATTHGQNIISYSNGQNEENRIATQLIKKTLDNVIADATYTIGGKSFKGRTGKKDFSKMGAQEIYQHTLSAKAEASAFNLLAEFGAVKDGKIQTADNGNTILVDTKKVARILEMILILLKLLESILMELLIYLIIILVY